MNANYMHQNASFSAPDPELGLQGQGQGQVSDEYVDRAGNAVKVADAVENLTTGIEHLRPATTLTRS